MRRSNSYMVLHVDLFVSSMSRSLAFYCEQMGFSMADDMLLRGDVVRSISNGLCEEVRMVLLRSSPLGAMIELLELQQNSAISLEGLGVPLPRGSVSLLVPDLDAHIGHVRSMGLYPVSDVFTVLLPQHGSCRLVFYEDPDSNRLEFIERGPRTTQLK